MLYIIGDELNELGSGVVKKVEAQREIFSNNGLICRIHPLNYLCKKDTVSKIKRRLPFINTHKHWNKSDILKESHIYIRNLGPWDGYAVDFFSEIKAANRNLKIVYELPTYPYDKELLTKWKHWPLFLKDIYNRRYIHSFIDRIATLTNDSEIFGIPTLKIYNGIDFERIRPRIVCDTLDIHIIAVAKFELWHGYDRLIEGLRVYYKQNKYRKVFAHMVGYGSEYERYRKMVDDYGLNEYVIFYGQQSGRDLDDIYDKCNLGVASLGFHRIGLSEGAPLKTREYMTKGLPFIFGAKVSDISEKDQENIYLQVPANDSPIDIESILNFYDRIYREGAEQVNNHLRQFAQDHFSMEVAMKEVIEFFKNGK